MALVLYVAGADPFINDTLGNLNITHDGMKRRDKKVFEFCKFHQMPVAVVLGGGYSEVGDLAALHFGTLEAMREVFGEAGGL